MKVTLLQKCHTPRLLYLVRCIMQEGKYAAQDCDDARVLELVDEYITDDGQTRACFVALSSDGEAVGFFVVELVRHMFRRGLCAQELVFYVMPEWRGSFAAAMLLTSAHDWAKQRGADTFMVGVSSPHDPTLAEGVYERVGFTKWGTLLRKEL